MEAVQPSSLDHWTCDPAVPSSSTRPHLQIANWFASHQLGFLTLLCLIEIICFTDLLGSTSLCAINTAEGNYNI